MRGFLTILAASLLMNQSFVAATTEGGRQLHPKQQKIPFPNELLGPDPHAWEKPNSQNMEEVREDKGEERSRRKGWEKSPKTFSPNPDDL